MPANAKWGRAGWGRTPSSLRRQTPPSFLYRHDPDTDTGTFGEIRFSSANDDYDFSSQSEAEVWVEALPSKADEE